MSKAAVRTQFVVLPTRGLQAPPSSNLARFLSNLDSARTVVSTKSFLASAGMRTEPDFKVVDSIHEDGAKLVEMTPDRARDFQASQPGLRIVPVVYYRPALARFEIQQKFKASAAAVKTQVKVTSTDGKPVRGVTVVAFTNFKNRQGNQGVTNSQGVVTLALSGAARVERLYAYPRLGFWGALRKNVSTARPIEVGLTPITLDYQDALRRYYGNSAPTAGNGVVVGVVDTGVGPHDDLKLAGGFNAVTGEKPDDSGDNGEGHGTHVAGIIAARGTPPAGIRGLAPGVTLRSYRVFGKGDPGASNFAIAKAIDRAVGDGCHLINLSLGGGPSDPVTISAIHDARAAGSLVIAATGNDDRGPVSFPAADPLCIAVSALGHKGTFPRGSVQEGDVMAPFGTADKDEFIAAFSNVGPEVDLTGPGVGILSTVPGGYAALSGTSMACPAVTGFAARLLAQSPNLSRLLPGTGNEDRSDSFARALLQAARDRGFKDELQGHGLL
jgi:subtilisin